MNIKNKFLGSTITMMIGLLSIAGSISQVAQGTPSAGYGVEGGFILVLGAAAYRSLKKTRLGLVPRTLIRVCGEIAAFVLIAAIVFGTPDLGTAVSIDPLPLVIFPLGVVVAYLFILRAKPAATVSTSEASSDPAMLSYVATRTQRHHWNEVKNPLLKKTMHLYEDRLVADQLGRDFITVMATYQVLAPLTTHQLTPAQRQWLSNFSLSSARLTSSNEQDRLSGFNITADLARQAETFDLPADKLTEATIQVSKQVSA